MAEWTAAACAQAGSQACRAAGLRSPAAPRCVTCGPALVGRQLPLRVWLKSPAARVPGSLLEAELPWISSASLGKAEEQGREAPSSDLPCSDPPMPVLTKPKRTPTKEKCLQGPAQVLQRRAKCRRRTERQLIHTWHVF